MKILFIGTVDFSQRSLQKLIELDAEIVGVCGKKKAKFNSDFVDLKLLSENHKIPFKYVDDINSDDSQRWIKSLNPEDCSLDIRENDSLDIVFNESGLSKSLNINFSVFASRDYKNYYEYNVVSNELLKEDAFLIKQDKTIKISSFLDTFAWIINEAKKGYSIQRYKGLGEMNPEQLWETTMDPENRTLIQIEEKDKAMAIKTFDDLMGDNVAPRKTFIEENAHFAVNIDI